MAHLRYENIARVACGDRQYLRLRNSFTAQKREIFSDKGATTEYSPIKLKIKACQTNCNRSKVNSEKNNNTVLAYKILQVSMMVNAVVHDKHNGRER